MADGRRSNVAGTARIPLEIGDYKETIEARVVDLADFDMVLGLSWLQSANPSIDWKAMAITVIDGSRKSHTLPLGQPYNLIQVLRTPAAENEFLLMGWDKSTKKVVQQKSANDLEDAYLYVVRSVQPPAENRKQRQDIKHLARKVSKKIQRILYRFASCFREELPEDLPPKRDIEHSIDTEDAKPMNLNAYPLNPVHLREQTQQIAKMLDQGLIQESASP